MRFVANNKSPDNNNNEKKMRHSLWKVSCRVADSSAVYSGEPTDGAKVGRALLQNCSVPKMGRSSWSRWQVMPAATVKPSEEQSEEAPAAVTKTCCRQQ